MNCFEDLSTMADGCLAGFLAFCFLALVARIMGLL